MQRRTFLGSLIALATLGKIPKAKAAPPGYARLKELAKTYSPRPNICDLIEAKRRQAIDDWCEWYDKKMIEAAGHDWSLEYASCTQMGPDGRLRVVTTPRPGEKGKVLMGSLGGVPIYGVERFGG